MTFRSPWLAVPAILLTTHAIVAQCIPSPPVVTSTAGTNGAIGHMFDVTNTSNAGVRIVALGQVMNLPGTSTFEIYTKAGSWAGFDQTPQVWTLVGSATGVSHPGAPNITAVPIPLDVAIPPGGTQGFYVTITQIGSIACSHTDGVTGQAQTIGTDGTIAIRSGPAKGYPFGESTGTPLTAGNVWNGSVSYCAGGSVDATNTRLGTGCIASYDSFYEFFPFASLADLRLTDNSLRFVRTPTGYRGEWLPGTAARLYRAPVAPTVLPVGDDGAASFQLIGAGLPTSQGPQNTLQVEANGIVFWGPDLPDFPGTFPWRPTVQGFLDNPPAGVYAWHDFDSSEPGSGAVVAEQVGNVAYVTFDNVESPALPAVANRSRLQFQFDLVTGDITLVFVRIDGNSTARRGSRYLVGISAQGRSDDPGAVNLATASPVAGQQVRGLDLSATSRPILGTTWNLRVDEIPATAVLGVHVLGLSDPSVFDLTLLGLPGCGLRASLDVLRPFPVAGPSRTYGEVLPAAPALMGLDLYAAAAVFTNPPANVFGAITSNGIHGRIGDF